MHRFLIITAAFAAFAVFSGAGHGLAQAALEGTGLPLPRFVSLRANEVNMRTGPGVQYPIEWVYHREALPMEVIAEYRTWRKVRDWKGSQGWVHQSMLGGSRTLVVTGKMRTVRAQPDTRAQAIARVEPNVVGRVAECPKGSTWCRIQVGGHEGWLRKVDFWGVYRDEIIR